MVLFSGLDDALGSEYSIRLEEKKAGPIIRFHSSVSHCMANVAEDVAAMFDSSEVSLMARRGRGEDEGEGEACVIVENGGGMSAYE